MRNQGPGADHRDRPHRPSLTERALALWPRLDRRALARYADDPKRLARFVSRRTRLSPEAILSMLVRGSVSDLERESWFG